MTVPDGKAPGSLVAKPRPVAPGTWWLTWTRLNGDPQGTVYEGSVDGLSEWAMRNGFTGVEVRPALRDHA